MLEADAGKPAAITRVLARWVGELQALQQTRQTMAALAGALHPQRAPGALEVSGLMVPPRSQATAWERYWHSARWACMSRVSTKQQRQAPSCSQNYKNTWGRLA